MGLIFVMALLGHDEYQVRELASCFPYSREHLLVLISKSESQEARIRAQKQLASIVRVEEIYFYYWHREYYYQCWLQSGGRTNRVIGDTRFIRDVQLSRYGFEKLCGGRDPGSWSRPNYVESDHDSLETFRKVLRCPN